MTGENVGTEEKSVVIAAHPGEEQSQEEEVVTGEMTIMMTVEEDHRAETETVDIDEERGKAGRLFLEGSHVSHPFGDNHFTRLVWYDRLHSYNDKIMT